MHRLKLCLPALALAVAMACADGDVPSGAGSPDSLAGGDSADPGPADPPPPPPPVDRGPDDPPPVAHAIELAVEPNPGRAGIPATVTCRVTDQYGALFAARVEVSTTPTDGIEQDGALLLATTLPEGGSYLVACEVPGTDVRGTVAWLVEPGPSRDLRIIPDAEIIRSGDAVGVAVSSVDDYGNHTAPELDWSAVGEDFLVVPLPSGRLRVLGSGWTTVIATDPESGATANFPLGVDRDAPEIEIISPERASFIPRGTLVKIEGHVWDDVGIDVFRVNGRDVPLSEGGSFSVGVEDLREGVHIIATEAEDKVGRKREGAQAFIYGTFGNPGAWTSRAIRLGMNPVFLDDNDPELDDISALAEAFVREQNIAPPRINLGCGGHVDIRNLRHSPPGIDLWPRVGGVGARVRMNNLDLDYSGRVCQDLWLIGCTCVSFSGTAHADSVTAEANADIGTADCHPTVWTHPSNASIQGLDLRLGGLASLLNPILGLFEGRIRGTMEEAVESAVDDTLSEALGGVLEGFALPGTFPLPSPMSGEIPMDTCFVAADFDDGGGHFDIDTRFPVETAIELPQHAGPLLTPGAPPSTRGPRAMGLALNDDLLNSLFFEAWRGGNLEGLDIGLGAGTGEDVGIPLPLDGLTINALLPPVLIPVGEVGEVPDLLLGMGDLVIQVETEAGVIRAAVSVILPATVEVNADRIRVLPTADADAVTLEMEILESPDLGAFNALLGALEELFRREGLPLILGQPIEVDLPTFGLGGLGVDELAGTEFGIGNPTLTLAGESAEHLKVEGDLCAAE